MICITLEGEYFGEHQQKDGNDHHQYQLHQTQRTVPFTNSKAYSFQKADTFCI